MELEEAKKEVNAEFIQISNLEFAEIKNNIANNFNIVIGDMSNFMWEQFTESSNICGQFAWKCIVELLPEHENYYLFFNQIECKNAYLFESRNELCDVIGETYNCEVYITDKNGTYIICFNHEMILCGCGRAKQWIDDFKEKNEM